MDPRYTTSGDHRIIKVIHVYGDLEGEDLEPIENATGNDYNIVSS